jgi:predicted phage terminase large subunit-like protein
MARPKQLPPDHSRHHLADKNGYRCQWKEKDGTPHVCTGDKDWFIWLFLAGRMVGKTMTGSNWILEEALKYPGTRWAVVAPTFQQVQEVCFTGDSGIIAQALPGEISEYNKNAMMIVLQNGSEIKGFSAEAPERIRGYNLSGAWLDEVGSYRNRVIWDEALGPALRKGNPRVVVTTTPSGSPLLREWVERFTNAAKKGEPCDIHLTPARFSENDTIPKKQLERLEEQYGGTRIGRQELEGEMLEDFEGALWKRSFIEDHRVNESDYFDKAGRIRTELFGRIVVAVDPSMTSGETSDESGIVVAGEGADGDGYLIADWSVQGTPEETMRRAVAAYYEYHADCVVMETNQGGDYLVKALRAADPHVPPRLVHASKGKMIRAQPISMLAEQGRLHHIGFFPKLEDQLCTLVPDASRNQHDDRADAFVWAMTELRGITDGSYLATYGHKYCKSCGKTIRTSARLCPGCGKMQDSSDDQTPTAGKWAGAYLNHCKKCGENYPQRFKKCPTCNPTPETYMAAVQKASGQGGGWLSYSGRDWFKGAGLLSDAR